NKVHAPLGDELFELFEVFEESRIDSCEYGEIEECREFVNEPGNDRE
uniref:LAO n=1 Tax=Panagrolaimus sp. PS1159 TaxID=55785 RepID=A0AC35FCE0_9BILA